VRSQIAGLVALAVAACSRGGDRAGGIVVSSRPGSGPDAVVIRAPGAGGITRAYRYPRLDTLVWQSSDRAPPIASILAFDQEDGTLAYLDRNGLTGWIDLRVGRVVPATKVRLASVTSIDAWAIYGILKDSTVQRLTPSGDWTLPLKGKALSLFALPNGSLIVLLQRGEVTSLIRLHPPESALIDSAAIPRPRLSLVSPLGDRLFFGVSGEVLAFGSQSLKGTARTALGNDVVAVVPTPSGDRLYVATKGSRDLAVIDRFASQRAGSVRLPGTARDLRMDPLGRVVLARPESGDSTWVVAVGTNRLLATIATAWRSDLPTVTADGSIAGVRDRDVVFVVPGEPRPRIIVRDGAKDVWYFIFWNGFRPRAQGLDQPVVFPQDSTLFAQPPVASFDTSGVPGAARADTMAFRPLPPVAVDTPSRPPPPRDLWTVSFAAVLSEDRARDLARQVRVDEQQARVVVNVTEGVRVHRVVLGPFGSRAEAERVGRASGRSYWVFEGPP